MKNQKNAVAAQRYLSELVTAIKNGLLDKGKMSEGERDRYAQFYADCLIVAACMSESDRKFFLLVYATRYKVGSGGASVVRNQLLNSENGEQYGTIINNIFSDDPSLQAQCQVICYALRSGLHLKVQQDLLKMGLGFEDFE